MSLDEFFISSPGQEKLQKVLCYKKEQQKDVDNSELKLSSKSYHQRSLINKQQHHRSASHVPRSMSSLGQAPRPKRRSLDNSEMRKTTSNLQIPFEHYTQSGVRKDFSPIFGNPQSSHPQGISSQDIESEQNVSQLSVLNSVEDLNTSTYSMGRWDMSDMSPMQQSDVGIYQATGMEVPLDLINPYHDPLVSPTTTTFSPYVSQYNKIRTSSTFIPNYTTTSNDLYISGTDEVPTSRKRNSGSDLRKGIEMIRFDTDTSLSTESQSRPNCSIIVHHSDRQSSTDDEKSISTSPIISLVPGSQFNTSHLPGTKAIESPRLNNNLLLSDRNIKHSHELKSIGAQFLKPRMPSLHLPMPKRGITRAALPKANHQVSKHDRVYCKQCDSHPEGFRGEHEFRRHQDREHKSIVRKFICIQPTDGSSNLKPVLPLSECKACNQMKKYNVYYNAAAHLRRTHFVPKVKGRPKSKPDETKRPGKAGAEWPSMAELKFWMKEVEESTIDVTSDSTKVEACILGNDSYDTSADERKNVHRTILSPIMPTNIDTNLYPQVLYNDSPAFGYPNLYDTNMNYGYPGTQNYHSNFPFESSSYGSDSTFIANSFPSHLLYRQNDNNYGTLQNMPGVALCSGDLPS